MTVRSSPNVWNPQHFGAVGDAEIVGDSWVGTDDTAAFQATVDAADYGDVVLVPGRHMVSNIDCNLPLTFRGSTGIASGVLVAAPGTTGYMLTLRNGGSPWNRGSHELGMRIEGVSLEGNFRQEDCGGINAIATQLMEWRQVTCRGFARRGISLSASVRESSFFRVEAKFCGDADLDEAGFDILHDNTQDAHNNLLFVGCQAAYNFGPQLRIGNAAVAGTTRNINFVGGLFHGGAANAVVSAGIVGNTSGYPDDPRTYSNPVVVVEDARVVRFSGSRMHLSGLGSPMILMKQGAKGATSNNSLHLTDISFGTMNDPAEPYVEILHGSDLFMTSCQNSGVSPPAGVRNTAGADLHLTNNAFGPGVPAVEGEGDALFVQSANGSNYSAFVPHVETYVGTGSQTVFGPFTATTLTSAFPHYEVMVDGVLTKEGHTLAWDGVDEGTLTFAVAPVNTAAISVKVTA